jgi:hypothetical protein
MPVIGFLIIQEHHHSVPPGSEGNRLCRGPAIEYRRAENQPDRLPAGASLFGVLSDPAFPAAQSRKRW